MTTDAINKTKPWLDKGPWKRIMGATAMGIPIGYLIYKHVSWQDTRQAKYRMLTHQLTFWGSMGVGLSLMHGGMFWKQIPFTQIQLNSTAKRILVGVIGGLIGAGGFKGGLWLSNKWFPHSHHHPKNEPGQAVEKAQESGSLPSLDIVSQAPIPASNPFAPQMPTRIGATPYNNPLAMPPSFKSRLSV